MNARLEDDDLARLIERVFRPGAADVALALLVDLPDERVADHPAWVARRALVDDWSRRLDRVKPRLGLETVRQIGYRNAQRNNADLPRTMAIAGREGLPATAEGLSDLETAPTERIFTEHQILIAVTELSATAPLKLAAARHGFRAATMPGFNPRMIPALKLDYDEIHQRCVALKERLDRSHATHIRFESAGRRYELLLDLRHRTATASGGLVRRPGTAGNLPSGETYIVPYEGERADDPSRTAGEMPLELEGELLVYSIESNRIRSVEGDGPRAEAERAEVAREPAYTNVAELGLGILAGYGIRPIGELLLDEKLGLHIAFGRSDHFGGQVGAAQFSSPDRVVHIDRVYLPEVQPRVRVLSVDLEDAKGSRSPLMRDGVYV